MAEWECSAWFSVRGKYATGRSFWERQAAIAVADASVSILNGASSIIAATEAWQISSFIERNSSSSSFAIGNEET